LLGEALLASQKFEKAAEQFEALSKLEPQNPKAWYGMGKSFEGSAVRTFENLEKAAPDSAYWFALVAATRVAQKQYRSAFFFYRKALDKQPNLRGIHVALSQIYRMTGNPEWASREEEKEVQLGLPNCDSEKRVCDFLAGRFHDVVNFLRNKQTPESYYWMSQAYNQLALDAFSRLENLPPSFEMHEVMAEIHRNQGRHLESVKAWKKALDLSPGNPIARRELALSLVLMHDYEGAKPLVDSLLAEEPASSQLNYLAGDILLNQQRPAEAIPLLKKALVSDPDFPSAHASLGRAYINTGQAASAIPHLKSALALDEDGSLHYQLARAYRSTGEKELAGQMLKKYEEIQKSLQTEKEQLEKEVRITPP
jgi:predicted Zn-dependent protease